jgi:hypothetical protein
VGAHRELPTLRAQVLISAGRAALDIRKLAAGLGAALVLAAVGAGGAQAAGGWSTPARLSRCAADAAPQVAFPSDKPTHATGPGAIVWSAAPGCAGGPGARVAEIGAEDTPGDSLAPRTGAGAALTLRGALTVSGAPHGRIAIAPATAGGAGAAGMLIEGVAGGPFTPLRSAEHAAAPVALSTAYQGDLAIASVAGGAGGLSVHVQRHFAAAIDRSAHASSGGAGAARALSVAIDFRSDTLTAWAQNGAIYAHDLPASGSRQPLQRVATVGAHTTIAALLSDDNRGIIAWVERDGAHTSVYLDQSATGVRFGAPKLLERFRNPDGLISPAASPRLVRLSSESVMLAWAGVANGHWVVHTAAIDQRGLRQIGTIATAGSDALLSDLAPGPRGEALAIWSEPEPGGTRRAVFSARGTESAPGRTFFGEPEEIAASAAPGSRPTVAFDPGSDRAVAVWQGANATIEYAIRASTTGP